MGIMYIDIMTIIVILFSCIMTIIHKGKYMSEFKQSKYINDFIKEKYDTFKVQVPKGQKELIAEHWKAKGYKSLNAYINDLIRKDMEQEATSVKNSHNVIIGNSGSIHME